MSLSDEDFIVPEEPLEQERFKRQLIATARSEKKKQQQLQAKHDTLNSGGPKSWLPKSMAFNDQQGVIRIIGYSHNLMMRSSSPYCQYITMLMNQTSHHVDEIKRPPMPNINLHHLTVEAERQRFQDTPTTYGRS